MPQASEEELKFHTAILNSDDLALSKLYDCYGERLIKILRRRYSKTETDFIRDAVNEALFGYYKNPVTFHHEKQTLLRFLEIATERDLINILEREKRSLGRTGEKVVALTENLRNRLIDGTASSISQIESREAHLIIEKELGKHFSNSVDITIAKMVIAGERSTEIFSEILSIKHLNFEEQKKEVKRHKDRVKKVLERNDVERKIKKLLI